MDWQLSDCRFCQCHLMTLYWNLMKQILDVGLDSDLWVFVSNLIPSLHVKKRERERNVRVKRMERIIRKWNWALHELRTRSGLPLCLLSSWKPTRVQFFAPALEKSINPARPPTFKWKNKSCSLTVQWYIYFADFSSSFFRLFFSLVF